MESTWWTRDLPVLDAAVKLFEQGNFIVTVRDIANATGFEPGAVAVSLDALEGEYVGEFTKFATGGDPNPWRILRVTPEARRAVGQWPTPENVVDRLAEAFSAAAEQEPDPERRSKLRMVSSYLADTGKGIAIQVVSKVIEHKTGMG